MTSSCKWPITVLEPPIQRQERCVYLFRPTYIIIGQRNVTKSKWLKRPLSPLPCDSFRTSCITCILRFLKPHLYGLGYPRQPYPELSASQLTSLHSGKKLVDSRENELGWLQLIWWSRSRLVEGEGMGKGWGEGWGGGGGWRRMQNNF